MLFYFQLKTPVCAVDLQFRNAPFGPEDDLNAYASAGRYSIDDREPRQFQLVQAL
jgi:hypothetical protein